jgi:hypothetical protein
MSAAGSPTACFSQAGQLEHLIGAAARVAGRRAGHAQVITAAAARVEGRRVEYQAGQAARRLDPASLLAHRATIWLVLNEIVDKIGNDDRRWAIASYYLDSS